MRNIHIKESIADGTLRQTSRYLYEVKDELRQVKYRLDDVKGSSRVLSDIRQTERLLEQIETKIERLDRYKNRSVDNFNQIDRELARQLQSEWRKRSTNQNYRAVSNASQKSLLDRVKWIIDTKGERLEDIANILGVPMTGTIHDLYRELSNSGQINILDDFRKRAHEMMNDLFDDAVGTLLSVVNITPIASAHKIIGNVMSSIPKCYDLSSMIDQHPELVFYMRPEHSIGLSPEMQNNVSKFKTAWQAHAGANALQIGVMAGVSAGAVGKLNQMTSLKSIDWDSYNENVNKAKKKAKKKKKNWLESAWDATTGAVGNAWDSTTDFVGGAVDATGEFIEDAWDATSDFAEDAWDATTDFAEDAWDATTQFAGDAWTVSSNVVLGAGDAVVGTVTGIWHLATHLPETWDSVCYVVQNYEEALPAIWDGITTYLDDNWTNGTLETRSRLAGQIIGEVVLSVVSAKGVEKLGKIKAASKAAQAAKVAENFEDVGDLANDIKKASDLIKAADIAEDIDDAAKILDKVEDTVDVLEDVEDVVGELAKSNLVTDSSSMNKVLSILDDTGLSLDEFNQLRMVSADTLTSSQKLVMRKIRDAIPPPTSETVLQKVIHKNDIVKYLDGDYSEVGGYITKANDVKQLENYDDVFNSLRLDYNGTQYNPLSDESVGIIRFKTPEAKKIDIPYSKNMGGEVIDEFPFTGNGFTSATNGRIIPEYKCSGRLKFDDGAELYEMMKDGTENLRAVYESELGVFIEVIE